AHDVVDIGAHRRQQVDALEVRRRTGETDVERVAVDHQRGLAEAELAELLAQHLGLGFADVEIVDDDQIAVARLGRQRHPEAELADLLVEARGEHAGARAVSLAAADEDRSAAIAVTGGAAALLAAELLAGAGNVAALTRGARRCAAVDQLPGDDAVEDVGARLDGENLVVELDVAASRGLALGAVEGLYLDLHRLAFLALVSRAGLLGSLLAGRSVSGLVGVGGRAGFLLGGDRRDFL